MHVTGLGGSALSYFLARFLKDLQRPCMVILPSRKESERLYRELRFFMQDQGGEDQGSASRLYPFPAYDLSPLTGLSPHKEVVNSRLEALYALTAYQNAVIITSLDAVCLKVMPKKAFLNALEYVEAGEEVERAPFLRRLEAGGYDRVSLVEERGDYSVRGGVIDIYPPLYTLPIRLEFWGDHLESIRSFDPLSQRSESHLREAVLVPAKEVIMDESGLERARSLGRLPGRSEQGMRFPGQEAWLNHFYPVLGTLFEYLSEKGMFALFSPHRLEPVCRKMGAKFQEEVERFRKEAAEKGVPFPEVEDLFVPFQDLRLRLHERQCLELSELSLDSEGEPEQIMAVKGPLHMDEPLDLRLEGKGRVSMAPLAEKISHWIKARGRVVLATRTEQQAGRLEEILENYGVYADQVAHNWAEIPEKPGLSVCLGRLFKGFVWPDLGLYVISEDEIFGPKRARSRERRADAEARLKWSDFSQLKEGDLVVHEDHGVGRYKGLTKMEIQKKANDFVIIEYAHHDRLYIPADRISILQKYVGANDGNPALDQLGGRSWIRAKQKAKNSVMRIAKQLVSLYALRRSRKGFSFAQPDHHYREFEATFEHEETRDQTRAIEAVLEDMGSERPMDRLVCGDVGFGKTEVAVRAAFKAVSDGKQVAVLVPTTVLAEQHYETFRQRMEPYAINVGILSRFKTKPAQTQVLGKLRSGKVDVLIGTHRILQKDVEFRDLGLLVIDEEQRFGVKQKESLKRYRALVDVLAITATPVPRTLQMSLMGVRDLSIIETPPEDRLAVQTYLSPYDDALIVRAFQHELDRGGQVFFVHNRVQTIDLVAEHLKGLFPQGRFAVAHGQMKERDLERTMMRFLNREVDILVCSAIIESGLDIPSANTIVINEVDRLGLAQIYQLRGRVGRAKEEAYAYLLLSNGAVMTRDAEKRLKALLDFTNLGAGLHLAMHDLRIRGGGNILGFSQSGHISAVGYEFYLKLLEQAVSELKGEEWHEEINPEINVDLPAFLPGDYVLDTDLRLNLYRRLSGLREKAELEGMVEEIRDRFGALPEEAENLLSLMSIRLVLKGMGVNRLDIGERSLILTFSRAEDRDPTALIRLVKASPDRFLFLAKDRLQVRTGPLSLPRDLKQVAGILEDMGLCLEQEDH